MYYLAFAPRNIISILKAEFVSKWTSFHLINGDNDLYFTFLSYDLLRTFILPLTSARVIYNFLNNFEIKMRSLFAKANQF